MSTSIPMNGDVMEHWLLSGKSARISGLDLKPLAHPAMPSTPRRVVKGQAAVYFMQQSPHQNTWLIKKFTPSRRPSDTYLQAVSRCIPGQAEFFTCTQRRFLTAGHLDRRYSQYVSDGLPDWIEGTILMPAVPGSSWATIADSLREGELELSCEQRLRAALNLAVCIECLEAWECSHRDISLNNVFWAPDDRVYLIDLDSLYHKDLPFQSNTTVGTLGYIPPFTRSLDGQFDAACSWCPHADRFALAVMIAEFLLVGPDAPEAQEDGSLFSQAQLAQPEDDFVKSQVDALWRINRESGILLWKALHAAGFESCPAPVHWRAVLQRALGSNRRHACSSVVRNMPDGVSQVVCEHCGRPWRISQPRLESLRSKGSPILCGDCLQNQMLTWKAEQSQHERDHPLTQCAECHSAIRLHKDKLARLQSAGKSPLCRTCLEQKPSLRNSFCPRTIHY